MSFLDSLLNTAKDAIIDAVASSDTAKNAALKMMAPKFFADYGLAKLGTLEKVEITTEKKEILVVLNLHGEAAPVEVTVHYRVLKPGEVEIVNVRSSKAWVAILVNEVVSPALNKIEVPTEATKFLA